MKHLTLALALATTALAQTFTSCNPLQKTCPDDKGLNAATFSTDFTTAGNQLPQGWKAEDGTTMKFGSNGAEFIIDAPNQAPTIETDFYFFFGQVDITLMSSGGTGIISSVVLESDDLDEIDFEFFGTGQYAGTAETNFFGKGNTTLYDRATYEPVNPAPASAFHTYTIDWNKERIIFSVDGAPKRTISATDPLTNGGSNYPQTPMRLKLGSWAGGASNATGTVEWAGGKTDYQNTPYIFYVKEVKLTNLYPGSSYTYTDMSGSAASIKVNAGSGSSGSLNVDGAVGGSSTATAHAASTSRSPKSGTVADATAAATSAPSSTKSHTKSAADAHSTLTSVVSVGSSHNMADATHAGSSSDTAPSEAVSTGEPEQQTASGAGINKVTLASVGLFTLSMCFWML